MRTENAVAPKTIYLKDYTPAPYLATQVNLSFNLLPGKTIVTILCDYGNRYQSKLFNPTFLKEKGLPVPGWLDRTAARVLPVVYEDA